MGARAWRVVYLFVGRESISFSSCFVGFLVVLRLLCHVVILSLLLSVLHRIVSRCKFRLRGNPA